MKIVYLGNGHAEFCTEVHLVKSLESMGHNVTLLQEGETSNEIIVEQANKADLFFWTHTWSWMCPDLATLKSIKCPTVFMHLDLVRGIPDREERVDASPWYRCDYVFMPDGDAVSVTWFRQKGINYHYSPPAVFHGGCYLAEPVEGWKQKVAFVGAKSYHEQWAYRPFLIAKLEEQYGENFTLYEHSSQMREHRLNQLYASVDVTVGDTFCPGFSRALYTSDRLFESVGRGSAVVYPRIKGVESYLEEGKEILYYDYGNWLDLFNKIDWLLANPDERNAMRLAGMEHVKREHTYVHRLKNVLDVVGGKPNIWESK